MQEFEPQIKDLAVGELTQQNFVCAPRERRARVRPPGRRATRRGCSVRAASRHAPSQHLCPVWQMTTLSEPAPAPFDRASPSAEPTRAERAIEVLPRKEGLLPVLPLMAITLLSYHDRRMFSWLLLDES